MDEFGGVKQKSDFFGARESVGGVTTPSKRRRAAGSGAEPSHWMSMAGFRAAPGRAAPFGGGSDPPHRSPGAGRIGFSFDPSKLIHQRRETSYTPQIADLSSTSKRVGRKDTVAPTIGAFEFWPPPHRFPGAEEIGFLFDPSKRIHQRRE